MYIKLEKVALCNKAKLQMHIINALLVWLGVQVSVSHLYVQKARSSSESRDAQQEETKLRAQSPRHLRAVCPGGFEQ